MRKLIHCIQSCFCSHDWELAMDDFLFFQLNGQVRMHTYRCTKCGHRRKYQYYLCDGKEYWHKRVF